MKLGNTGGRNKGKRYVKLTGDETLTPEREEAVRLFAGWFNDNCENIKKRLIDKNAFDADVFADTYLKVYDAIAFKRLNPNNYSGYFNRAYITNKFSHDCRESERLAKHYDINRAWNIPDEYPGIDDTVIEIKGLTESILGYVSISYPPRDVSLFEIYIQAKPAMSYKELSRLTKVPYYIIAGSISAILKDIKESFGLRYTTITG